MVVRPRLELGTKPPLVPDFPRCRSSTLVLRSADWSFNGLVRYASDELERVAYRIVQAMPGKANRRKEAPS
jgi:hypothetical protein